MKPFLFKQRGGAKKALSKLVGDALQVFINKFRLLEPQEKKKTDGPCATLFPQSSSDSLMTGRRAPWEKR